MNAITSKPEAAGAPAQDTALQDYLGAPPSRQRRWRRWAIIGGVVLLALLLIWWFTRGDESTAYVTQDVERGNLTVSVSATGNLAPTNQVEVGSEQSGLVTDVYVENNDRVSKGQPLARLDTSRLQDTITQNRAAVAAAMASVAQAEASAVNARSSLNRLEEVYRLSGGKVPSKSELDSARAENLRAIAQVRSAQAQVTQQRASLQSSLTNLSKATIYSPVNGVVLLRQVDPGQTVAASFQAPVLFTIAEDLSNMKLEVKVDEADVGQVRDGQPATFTVDAFPGRTFPATIKRVDVGSSASATTGATGGANSVVSYTAELSVQNADFALRPGMTATADIVTMSKCNVLLVPNSALRFNPVQPQAAAPTMMPGAMPPPRRPRPERQVGIGRGSRQTVYVVGANGEPQAVQVTVGNTNGATTEVVGGLKPGQKVITSRMATSAEKEAAGSEKAGGARKAGGPRGAGARGAAGGGRGAACVNYDGGAPQAPAGAPAGGPAAATAGAAGNAANAQRNPQGQAAQGGAGAGRRFDPNDPRVRARMEAMRQGGGRPPEGQGFQPRRPGE
jgi:HlyD family secretion protein